MKKKTSRQEILEKELISYQPKPWRINIPKKDYAFKIEDTVPALSGVIGKISLVAAFAVAWSAGFNITDPTFVTENVRLEIVLASLLTILFCAILNPYAGPPGTLAPLIPMIPLMIASGVHPLPLSLLIGVIGLLISAFRYFSKVVELNGPGTKAGIILLFGILGISSSLESLKSWAMDAQGSGLFVILLFTGTLLYILFTRLQLKWLVIPSCAVIALVISALFGLFPKMETGIGLPIINPDIWWNMKWGIGYGLTAENFIRAIPFALLAVVMWPIDALAIKTIQEDNYPKEAKNAVFHMNSTYLIVSLRNILGGFLGGTQIAAIWRSYMIPLAIVKRPIGASALLLGLFGISVGILGFPIDIATFPPLLWMVLLFGVFVPMLEVSLYSIRNVATAQIAAVCLIIGLAVNPVLGWIAAVFAENFNMIKNPDSERVLSKKDRYITIGIIAITIATFLLTP